jgi:hypothetical protein
MMQENKEITNSNKILFDEVCVLRLCLDCISFPFIWRVAANGTRFSRREASAASEAVGWKRMLAAVSLICNLFDHI